MAVSQTLVEVYTQCCARYGEDVTHQAMLRTLERQPEEPCSYLRALAKVWWHAGYTDAKIGPSHVKTWNREAVAVSAIPTDAAPMWSETIYEPEPQAAARETLEALPRWLIALHIEDGIMVKHPCVKHPCTSWYPARYGGRVVVRCRQCIAGRMQSIRQARQRRKEAAHAMAQ